MTQATHQALATPTLVRLYLGQGHFEQAEALAMALIQRLPENGEAMTLVKRCQDARESTLKTRWSSGRLTLRWDLNGKLQDPSQAQLRVHVFQEGANCAEPEFREIRCNASAGKVTIPLPTEPGACTSLLCLHGDVNTIAQRILAIGRVHRWDRSGERRS